MQGARILYVRELAAVRGKTDDVERLNAVLDAWAGDVAENDFVPEWSANLDAFFAYIRALNPRISAAEERFVRNWATIALDDPAVVRSSPPAADLVATREAQVKGGRARLTAAQDKPREDRGTEPAPLTFRWGNGRQIAADIRAGLAA
jgi:hypothetical protein